MDLLRSFTRLKLSLMPYLFDAAGQAHRDFRCELEVGHARNAGAAEQAALPGVAPDERMRERGALLDHLFRPDLDVRADHRAVADFGADPTGATDSTAKIQVAVNAGAAAGRIVYLPAGSYALYSHVIVDRVTLAGSTTTQTPGKTDWWLHPQTGLPVRIRVSIQDASDTPIGKKAQYEEAFELRLQSLAPQD